MIGPASHKNNRLTLMMILSRIRIPDRFSTSLSIAKYGSLRDPKQSPAASVHDTRRSDWRRRVGGVSYVSECFRISVN